ncbi:hypothetical protein ACFVUY_41980 [Kitasatospora sp. NPDC058063]|uniref:hypothetical protein n=1 Tax=unclassified Kitasatospora TaxID=2633591 RepID=UPI0036DA6CD1
MTAPTFGATRHVLSRYSVHTSRQLIKMLERVAAANPGRPAVWKSELTAELEKPLSGLQPHEQEVFRIAVPAIASYVVGRYLAAREEEVPVVSKPGGFGGPGIVVPPQTGPRGEGAIPVPIVPGQSTGGDGVVIVHPGATGPTDANAPVAIQEALFVLSQIDTLTAALPMQIAAKKTEIDHLGKQRSDTEAKLTKAIDDLRDMEEAAAQLPRLREVAVSHPLVETLEQVVEITQEISSEVPLTQRALRWIRSAIAA